MSSTLSWLDYSEDQRRQVLDIVDLFDEESTRDELGLASVHYGLADILLPGTGTVQTRAKYFLFVPWIYRDLIEKRRVPSARAPAVARKHEIELIEALASSRDKHGVIGIQARGGLQRLPSNIYWHGLGIWRIRLCDASQGQYHHSLDAFYGSQRAVLLDDDRQPASGAVPENWHAGLPPCPDGFPASASFDLTKMEARYLRDRILTAAAGTFLAHLLLDGEAWEPDRVDLPWKYPRLGALPPEIREQIDHARRLSQAMHGIALLYNLMLAEETGQKAWVEHYSERLGVWGQSNESQVERWRAWDIGRLWSIIQRAQLRLATRSTRFVEQSLATILRLRRLGALAIDGAARDLVKAREREVKGPGARLGNPRALELWQGRSGDAPMDFRWSRAQRVILDILKGVSGRSSRA